MHKHDHHHESSLAQEYECTTHHADDVCVCGCGDHHEGHDHHHDHHQQKGFWTDHRDHDGAQVVSGGCRLNTDYNRVGELLTEQLSLLAKKVTEKGGIVGHIKAAVEACLVKSISVTDLEATVTEPDTQEIKVNIAAIVFAAEISEVELFIKGILTALKALSSD